MSPPTSRGMTLGQVVSIYWQSIRGIDTGVFYGDEAEYNAICEDYLDKMLRLVRTATGELCEDERYRKGWWELPYPGCVATLSDLENLVNGWVLVLNRAADQLLLYEGSEEKDPEDYQIVFDAVNALNRLVWDFTRFTRYVDVRRMRHDINLFAWKFHVFPSYLPNA